MLIAGRWLWLLTPLLWIRTRQRWVVDWVSLRGFDRAQLPAPGDVNAWLVYLYSTAGQRLRPLQSQWELARLAQVLAGVQANRVLEIGTASGGTFAVLAQASSPAARLISVDLPGGLGGGGYPAWKARIYAQLTKPTQESYFLRGDSHTSIIQDRVVSLLADELLDVLFIDGDHSYAGVKRDFEFYSNLVRPGGLICFHDIVPNNDNPLIGVDVFWREVKQDRQSQEFIDPAALGQFGIGIIRR